MTVRGSKHVLRYLLRVGYGDVGDGATEAGVEAAGCNPSARAASFIDAYLLRAAAGKKTRERRIRVRGVSSWTGSAYLLAASKNTAYSCL
jgi:hypothetical protein|eukprot:2845783-Prymnesium_polylepis.2